MFATNFALKNRPILQKKVNTMKNSLNAPIIEQADENNTVDESFLPEGFITVDIPQWIDKSIGDTVTCYFGTHTLKKIVSDLTSLVIFKYSPAQVPVGQYSVYYTISDAVGNTNTSPKTAVTVIQSGGGTGTDTYPAPVVPQAVGGVIDLGSLSEDIEVCCYPTQGLAGTTLRLHFGALIIDKLIPLQASWVQYLHVSREQVAHGHYTVYYEVLKNNVRVGISPIVMLQCMMDTVVYKPLFPQAVDGVINLEDEFTYVEMDIRHYDAAEEGDVLQCYIGTKMVPIIVEDASTSVFRARFAKDELTAGTFQAHYAVVVDDDYKILSPSVTIAFNDKETPPIHPEPSSGFSWPETLRVPEQGNIGDVLWKSHELKTSYPLTIFGTQAIAHGMMYSSLYGKVPRNGLLPVCPGVSVAFIGSIAADTGAVATKTTSEEKPTGNYYTNGVDAFLLAVGFVRQGCTITVSGHIELVRTEIIVAPVTYGVHSLLAVTVDSWENHTGHWHDHHIICNESPLEVIQ